MIIDVQDLSKVSDGYHTIAELYDHRITLFIALCRLAAELFNTTNRPWRSRFHSDGNPAYEGWYIMGLGMRKGEQISYHIPLSRWEETNFVATLDKAPEWDGHTSADVLERLKAL